MRKTLGDLGRAVVQPLLYPVMLVLLISPTICHAQTTFTCPFTAIGLSSTTWLPGENIVTTSGGDPGPLSASEDCEISLVQVFDWPVYPAVLPNDVGPPDPYVTISALDNYDPTHARFTATVSSGAPNEEVVVEVFCLYCYPWFSEIPVQIGPSAPPPPPPPVCPTPAITSVTPDIWFAGKTYNTVAIKGSGFTNTTDCPAPQVNITDANDNSVPFSGASFANASKMVASAVAPPASDPTETACVTLGSEQPIGPIGGPIMMASAAKPAPAPGAAGSPCTDQSGNTGITVQIDCATPTITSVTPDGWWAGQKQQITISGSCFFKASDPGGPTKLTISATDVTLTNPVVVSDTQITATVDVSKKAPAETATVTVTNPSTDGTQQTATANPAPVVLPVPVIKWLGKTISGDTAKNQSVIVGQPVELTTTPATLPGGFTVSKSTWVVPGTNIKQYHEDDDDGISVDETDLDTTNTSFYWLYKGDPLNVTYDYCSTDPSGNQFCTSPQAQATFKATEPNITLTTTEPYDKGKVNKLAVCGQKAKESFMFYGDLNYLPVKCSGSYMGPPGINLTASGASGGKYMFVQVIQSDTLTWNGSTPHSCGPYQMVLDGHYPFPGVYPNAPSVAYDGPGMSLPNKYTSGKRDFDATMYLLWQPDQLSGTATASIPVPIGHQEWHFVATTEQNPPIGKGKWEKPDTTSHGDNGGYQASQATDNDQYGYPSWNGISDISSCNPE